MVRRTCKIKILRFAQTDQSIVILNASEGSCFSKDMLVLTIFIAEIIIRRAERE
jgi:hypothetical protein